jgi:hypothetical protein
MAPRRRRGEAAELLAQRLDSGEAHRQQQPQCVGALGSAHSSILLSSGNSWLPVDPPRDREHCMSILWVGPQWVPRGREQHHIRPRQDGRRQKGTDQYAAITDEG